MSETQRQVFAHRGPYVYIGKTLKNLMKNCWADLKIIQQKWSLDDYTKILQIIGTG